MMVATTMKAATEYLPRSRRVQGLASDHSWEGQIISVCITIRGTRAFLLGQNTPVTSQLTYAPCIP